MDGGVAEQRACAELRVRVRVGTRIDGVVLEHRAGIEGALVCDELVPRPVSLGRPPSE